MSCNSALFLVALLRSGHIYVYAGSMLKYSTLSTEVTDPRFEVKISIVSWGPRNRLVSVSMASNFRRFSRNVERVFEFLDKPGQSEASGVSQPRKSDSSQNYV